jgi:hypothetical protein
VIRDGKGAVVKTLTVPEFLIAIIRERVTEVSNHHGV